MDKLKILVIDDEETSKQSSRRNAAIGAGDRRWAAC